jgi:microcin C transport system substrate-binding protein
MSSTPGRELRQYFGSESADIEGSNNMAGLKNEAVDALLAKIEQAETRQELETAAQSARPRVAFSAFLGAAMV